jgi:hypothetical protein
MANDIKFVKTNKEWKDIQDVIAKEHLNSFIHVNSQSENNIYIGTDRVTDNYNSRVEDGRVINNVGGIESGIHVSELKGMSISEILDTILFVENNNLSLKGVQVVDKIENLTDSTLKDVYQGMVVSVVEDNSLYILLTDSDEREWKKVGSDIDIEELKTSTRKLSAPITVAGLSDSLGANISNGKTYTTDNTIEDILRDLLCKEIYPTVSLSTTNPTITFGGLNGAAASNYKSIMKIGSVLNLDSVTLSEATISNCYRKGVGFTYGYSTNNDDRNDGNPPVKNGSASLSGSYSLSETYSPSTIGEVRTVSSSENFEEVKFGTGSVTIGLGSNIINISATSPSGIYSHPEYPEYYIVSNLGNTDVNKKLLKTDAINGTIDSIEYKSTISVIGVYPVYVNIESGSFVDETIEMELTASDTFEFNVPSEVGSGIHFTFDYPATHSFVSFKIKDLIGNFVDYKSTYEIKELEDKVVGNIKYNRLTTTGNFQGEGTYKITLSKRLDEE